VSRLSRCLYIPLVLGVSIVAVGCGGSGLTASSTCADFMSASPEEQSAAISKLSSEFDTPETATPLGAPNVPYVCAQEPAETLGEYFERAHEAEG
jgi:hypothetical protein